MNDPANLDAYAFEVNPQPWAVGTFSAVRNKQTGKMITKPSPDMTLVTYQNSIREMLEMQGAVMREGKYALRFTFSRQLDKYVKTTGKGTATRNQADGTNMMKATEDALQGVIIGNDRDVVTATWVMSGPQLDTTDPWVIVELVYGLDDNPGYGVFPPNITHKGTDAQLDMIDRLKNTENLTDLEWTP